VRIFLPDDGHPVSSSLSSPALVIVGRPATPRRWSARDLGDPQRSAMRILTIGMPSLPLKQLATIQGV